MSRITVPLPTRGRAPSHSPPDVHYAPGYNLARAMGWFSIGLGLIELLAPRETARFTGVPHTQVLRGFGIREIVIGIGILTSDKPAPWMWGRVAGDIVDLATLGEAYVMHDEAHTGTLIAVAAVAGVLAVDAMVAAELSAAARLEG